MVKKKKEKRKDGNRQELYSYRVFCYVVTVYNGLRVSLIKDNDDALIGGLYSRILHLVDNYANFVTGDNSRAKK